jgi:hypothetical protein
MAQPQQMQRSETETARREMLIQVIEQLERARPPVNGLSLYETVNFHLPPSSRFNGERDLLQTVRQLISDGELLLVRGDPSGRCEQLYVETKNAPQRNSQWGGAAMSNGNGRNFFPHDNDGSAEPDEPLAIDSTNRLRIFTCPKCAMIFAATTAAIGGLRRTGKPVFCPAGHPAVIPDRIEDISHLVIFDAQVLAEAD